MCMDLWTKEGEVKGYEMVYYRVTRYRTRKLDMSLLYTKMDSKKAKFGEVKAKVGKGWLRQRLAKLRQRLAKLGAALSNGKIRRKMWVHCPQTLNYWQKPELSWCVCDNVLESSIVTQA